MEVVINLIVHPRNPRDLNRNPNRNRNRNPNRNRELPLHHLDTRNLDTDLHRLSLNWKLTAKDTNLEAATKREVEAAAEKEVEVEARKEVAAANAAAVVALLETTRNPLLRLQSRGGPLPSLQSRTTPALNLPTRTCTPRAKDIAAVEALPADTRREAEVAAVNAAAAVALLGTTKNPLLRLQSRSGPLLSLQSRITTPALTLSTRTCIPKAKDIAAAVAARAKDTAAAAAVKAAAVAVKAVAVAAKAKDTAAAVAVKEKVEVEARVEITKSTLLRPLTSPLPSPQNRTTPALTLPTRTCIPRAKDIVAVVAAAVEEKVEALPADPRSHRLTDILVDLDQDLHLRIAVKLN